jgi:hypothetical protein
MTRTEEPNEIVKSALDEAVSLLNQGKYTPTEALRKVAESHDLNDRYIHRVGEALNVALSLKHFKTAADRAADFPIADIPGVVRDFYQDDPVIKEKKAQAAVIPGDSFEKVADFRGRFFSRRGQEGLVSFYKTALEEPEKVDPRKLYKQAVNFRENVEKELQEQTGRHHELVYELNRTFSDLVNGFSKDAAARTSFSEFESQVFSRFGKKAEELLDLVYETAGLSEERGVHDSKYHFFDDCPELNKMARLLTIGPDLAAQSELVHVLKEKKAEVDQKLQEIRYATAKIAELKEQEPLATPAEGVVEKKDEDVKEEEKKTEEKDPVLERLQEEQEKQKEAAEGLASGALFGFALGSGPGDAKKGKSTDFQTGQGVGNVERRAILQELLFLDPVLSKEDPRKVTRLFEQILRLAPNLTTEKEVVRALLRQMLATEGLGAFEANQLTEADLNRMKQKLMLAGKLIDGKGR